MPSGAARPKSLPHGGPLSFSLTGSLSVGQSTQTQTRGDQSTGVTDTTTTTPHETAGMQAQVARRTLSTTLQLGLPIGLAFHQNTNLGQITAGYYTPEYGILYGPQQFALLGGVPLGATTRGFAFLVPVRTGDLTLFNGSTQGIGTTQMQVYGLRLRSLVKGTLFEASAESAHGSDGSTVGSLVFGAARTSGELRQSVEAALEKSSNVPANSFALTPGDGNGRGFAYQYRADYGGNASYVSFLARRITNDFVALGSGELPSDGFASMSYRITGAQSTYGIDESFESSGAGGTQTEVRRGAFSFTRAFERSGIQTGFSVSDQRQESSQGTYWIGTVSSQLGFTVLDVATLFGVQMQRATLTYGPDQSLVTYTGALQRQFGQYSTNFSWQDTRLGGGQSGKQTTGLFSLTRNFAATSVTLSTMTAHNVSPFDDIKQISPTVTIARRISPVATLALTYGITRTVDANNPLGTGTGKIFSLQIAAPFAIGNGLVQGRADPRLPATITGTVLNDTGNSQLAYSGAVNNGVGNIVVVMDDTIVQRTDLSGRYQFNFVTPGTHQIRLESSSLPRGVTVDQPYAQVTVQGGQTAQVSFMIGTYGAVAGHVYAKDSSGSSVPLAGVSLEMDGTAYAKTDPLGAYSFGKLTSGPHSVEIVEASLPAAAAFSKEAEKQKVNVRDGEISTLDFTASPLGSIAGFVTFAPEMAPEHKGGVNNAYVVANPGDYAAITNDDGSFLLDNIPPGTYTLDLDPETLPDGSSNASGTVSITMDGTQSKEGVHFTVGPKQKAVVFTFKTSTVQSASATISEPALPPGGTAEAVVDAGGAARSVSGTFMGKSYAFAYDAARKRWVATIEVPEKASAAKETLLVDIRPESGQPTSASADVDIEPDLPLVSFKITPPHAGIGHYVTVRARFLVDVRAGDTIRWPDGQVTKLGKPVTGRVFVFSVKISERLMRGTLLTRQGPLPIILR